MRIDDFLSTVGVVKRRTVAKELATAGMIEVNGRRAKAAYDVKPNDIIHIKGKRSVTVEVIAVPTGSVPKDQRDQFVKKLNPLS
jgi:ribosomal 50S subunit-recycling heat shock protein